LITELEDVVTIDVLVGVGTVVGWIEIEFGAWSLTLADKDKDVEVVC
jgi:hypothetical protein